MWLVADGAVAGAGERVDVPLGEGLAELPFFLQFVGEDGVRTVSAQVDGAVDGDVAFEELVDDSI
jgi:hypothetical protein